MTWRDMLVSVTRTWCAIAAGALITWGAAHGLGFSETVKQPLAEVLFAVVTAGYYLLARLAEHRWPRAGVLFGVPKRPAYGDPGPPSVSSSPPR